MPFLYVYAFLKLLTRVSPFMNSLQELVQQNLHIPSPVIFIVLNEGLDVENPAKYKSLYKCFTLTTNTYFNNFKMDIDYLCDI